MKNEKPVSMKINFLLFRAKWIVDEKGDYKKALAMYQKIVDSGNHLADAYCGIGVCQKMLGNQESAIVAAKEALQINHTHYKTLQLLASIYHPRGNEELTYEYVSRALACKPKTMTEIYPQITDFSRKALRSTSNFVSDDYIEDTVEFDYLDATWVAWAQEFKTEYEANHPCKTQEQNGNA